MDKIEIREFTDVEITEINKYINVNVPYSVLQQLYPLSENLMNKSKVFIMMYRIIYGAYNYVEKPETKEKINRLLMMNKEIYNDIFTAIINYENSDVNFGKRNNLLKLKYIFTDFDKNYSVNKMIDAFLIFSEKVTLLRTDSFVGLDLETKEGEEVYNKLVASIDKPAEKEEVSEETDIDTPIEENKLETIGTVPDEPEPIPEKLEEKEETEITESGFSKEELEEVVQTIKEAEGSV